MEEVRPFLANVLRGRAVPPERLEEVVRHYAAIGGRSPLNELTFRQAKSLQALLRAEGPALPIYVGMRNWHPYLRETLGEMHRAGVRRALGLILAAQQSDASWYRYERDVADAAAEIGGRAPAVEFVDSWHAHPLFIEAVAERLTDALGDVAPEPRAATRVLFTAHSIPTAMAARAPYVAQLTAGATRVAARAGVRDWALAYQSRSGNPREPWLGPDIGEVVRAEAAKDTRALVVVPIGFVCDHVEVLYDLDIEAKRLAESFGMRYARAASLNDHPTFIRMMADVIRTHVARR